MENLAKWTPDPKSDSYRLGALAQAARLYLISGAAGDRKVLDRLSAEVFSQKPIDEA